MVHPIAIARVHQLKTASVDIVAQTAMKAKKKMNAKRKKFARAKTTLQATLLNIVSILKSCVKESDDLRTLDCYSRGITMKIDLDFPSCNVIVKGSPANLQYLRNLSFLVIAIGVNSGKNRCHITL